MHTLAAFRGKLGIAGRMGGRVHEAKPRNLCSLHTHTGSSLHIARPVSQGMYVLVKHVSTWCSTML